MAKKENGNKRKGFANPANRKYINTKGVGGFQTHPENRYRPKALKIEKNWWDDMDLCLDVYMSMTSDAFYYVCGEMGLSDKTKKTYKVACEIAQLYNDETPKQFTNVQDTAARLVLMSKNDPKLALQLTERLGGKPKVQKEVVSNDGVDLGSYMQLKQQLEEAQAQINRLLGIPQTIDGEFTEAGSADEEINE